MKKGSACAVVAMQEMVHSTPNRFCLNARYAFLRILSICGHSEHETFAGARVHSREGAFMSKNNNLTEWQQRIRAPQCFSSVTKSGCGSMLVFTSGTMCREFPFFLSSHSH